MQAQFDEGWDPVVLEWAAAVGLNLKAIRFNFLQTKTASGDFSAYAPALNAMKRRGLKHYLTLFGAPYLGDTEAYANWAEKALLWHVQHYPGLLDACEIWNEPDGTHWPIPPGEYVALVKAIYARKIRHHALEAIDLAGPTAGGAYMEEAMAAGLLDYVQIHSFHMYLAPEVMLKRIGEVRRRLAEAGHPDMPICISEWGAIPPHATPGAMERALTIFRITGTYASYFPLKDYGGFSSKGLITSTGAPKSQADSFIKWHAQVGDAAQPMKTLAISDTTYGWAFRRPDGSIVNVLWSTTGQTVLINGRSTSLSFNPLYVNGSATVVLA